MTAQWVKYDGSDEQIAEIETAYINKGFILPRGDGSISDVIQGSHPLARDITRYSLEESWKVKEYLICQPHPYADMICQWARTGQPVWVRYAKVCHFGQTSEYEICNQIATNTPDWNIPNAEYSFTPFED